MRMIKKKEREFFIGKMEGNILGLGKMGNNLESAFIIQMKRHIVLENGLRVKGYDGSINRKFKNLKTLE